MKSSNWRACGGCFRETIDDSGDGKPVRFSSDELRYACKASSAGEFGEDKLPIVKLFSKFPCDML